MRERRFFTLLLLCVLAVGFLAGCAKTRVRYVDDEGKTLRTDDQGRPILPDAR